MAQEPFRFIHCADLHLGAAFRSLPSLGQKADAYLLESTYRAFSQVVDLALEERVDAFLIAGDIYNEADHNLEAQVRFVRELERLSEAGIQTYIVHGNHDPLSAWSAKIQMPKGVHVFSGDRVECVRLVVRGKVAANVYGMSHHAEGVYEDLTTYFSKEKENVYRIGLLHASVGDAKQTTPYAPTTLQRLKDVGMQYWALGHIHKREVLAKHPWIVYAGNTQAIRYDETGHKGCYLVSVSGTGHTEAVFHKTESIGFEVIELSITNVESFQELKSLWQRQIHILRNAYKKPVLYKLILTGEGPLSAACRDAATRNLWLKEAQEEEKGTFLFVMPHAIVDMTTWPISLQERRHIPDIVGDYLKAYDILTEGDEDEVAVRLRQLLEQRTEWKRIVKYDALFTKERLFSALKRAEREGALRMIGDMNED